MAVDDGDLKLKVFGGWCGAYEHVHARADAADAHERARTQVIRELRVRAFQHRNYARRCAHTVARCGLFVSLVPSPRQCQWLSLDFVALSRGLPPCGTQEGRILCSLAYG